MTECMLCLNWSFLAVCALYIATLIWQCHRVSNSTALFLFVLSVKDCFLSCLLYSVLSRADRVGDNEP